MKLRLGLIVALCGLVLLVAAILRNGGEVEADQQNGRTESSTLAQGERTPVLVELFTSEGCSDCPPADALLARLARTQPVAGAQVIGLEHHVDYWDHQGWRDPFSSAAASARQVEYARTFGNDSPYTPQMVVDGTAEFVGSNESAARRAIDHAAHNAKASIELSWSTSNASRTDLREVLEVRIHQLAAVSRDDPPEVFLAVTEDNLHSNVARGENAGRALDHVSVVRRLERLGKADPGQEVSFTAHPAVKLESSWKRPDLRVVVFVQQQKSCHVLAAATLPLLPPRQ
jgi:hypothetical protein